MLNLAEHNIVTIDFETRSKLPLGGPSGVGMHRYAEDPSTDVLCLAVKVNDQEPMIYAWDRFVGMIDTNKLNNYKGAIIKSEARFELASLFLHCDLIEAHNVGFERTIWHNIMHKRYGYPDLPFGKLRDSSAKAAVYSLPRDLQRACEVMGCAQQKDKRGHTVMLQMCKPRAANKAEKTADPDWEKKTYWREDEERIVALLNYCQQDVNAEYALSQSLRDLAKDELKVWQLDQEMNWRGIYCDVPACETLYQACVDYKLKLVDEFTGMTCGVKPSQGAEFLKILKVMGVELPDLRVASVKKALAEKKLGQAPRRLLEIRQIVAKTSIKKLVAVSRRACSDNRVRGSLMYHGAGTGRWTARGIQPQNFPRDTMPNVDDIISIAKDGLLPVFYEDVINTVSRCLRGMLCAPEGKSLVCADFASIEGRVLAWLADEFEILDAYLNNVDMYKRAATTIYNKDYDNITKDERQIGKVAELALGYQGGWRALQSMGLNYDVEVGQVQGAEIVKKWRASRPKTKAYWGAIERAAIKAVKSKGEIVEACKVKFAMRGQFLLMKLPSGRNLYFCQPQLEWDPKWKCDKMSCMRMNDKNQWVRTSIYGGLLTENVVQALARDLMARGMLEVSKLGYEIVTTIHDEILAECDRGKENLMEFCSAMCTLPIWAEGIPIIAKGWTGKRYRK
jgi:DNA polymerase